LIGDAAGLADEFSAEGIYYGVRSGRLAAAYIARAATEDRTGLTAYERAIDRVLMPELRAARLLARAFYLAGHHRPRLTLRLLRRWDYPVRAVFRQLRGDRRLDAELRRWPIPAALHGALLRGGPL
jgi:flavin-dependent dehydrogenase